MTILEPVDFYHPNSSPGRGLCLGHPPAAIGMEAILQLTFAALTFSSFNTVEWQGLNPEAAQFVRSHATEFPLLSTGLYELPPSHLLIDPDSIGPEILVPGGEGGAR